MYILGRLPMLVQHGKQVERLTHVEFIWYGICGQEFDLAQAGRIHREFPTFCIFAGNDVLGISCATTKARARLPGRIVKCQLQLQAFKAVLLVGATMCSLSTQTCLHDVFQTPRIYKEKYSDWVFRAGRITVPEFPRWTQTANIQAYNAIVVIVRILYMNMYGNLM